MQNIEAPRPIQTVIPAPAGENVVVSPSTQTLDRTLASNRNIGLRRRIGLAGAGLVLAASSIGAAASFGSRANAQGAGESPAPSPAPAVTMEPGASFDPNGNTAELPCDPETVPAAVVNPDGQAIAAISGSEAQPVESPEASPVLVVPSPSAPAEGESNVGGDPDGEVCDLGPTAREAFEMLLSQEDLYEGDKGLKRTPFKKLKSEFFRKPDAEKGDLGGIWYRFNEELLQLNHPFDLTVPIDKSSFEIELDIIENGLDFTESKKLSRLQYGAGFAIFLLGLREQTTNPELGDALLKAADIDVEHLLTVVAQDEFDIEFTREQLQNSASVHIN